MTEAGGKPPAERVSFEGTRASLAAVPRARRHLTTGLDSSAV
jgi:hypothetical protein